MAASGCAARPNNGTRKGFVTEPIAYLNGRIIPASELSLPVYDAGVVMGVTVSEMVRTFRHRPFRLDDHLDRLLHSLKHARIDIDVGKDELGKVSHDLVEHNARPLDTEDDLGLVIFVTAGPVPTYRRMAGWPAQAMPAVCIHTFPLAFDLYAAKMKTGAHLITPSIRQVPAASYDPQMKCRSRMHYYLAQREAQAVEPDATALLLDLNGNVTETNTANFLMVKDGTIFSPRVAEILPGISRETVFQLADRMQIPFEERKIPLSDALTADEAFLSSTPYCLMPVTRMNGATIGNGVPGPIYRRLMETWSSQVGLDIEKQIEG
jgi:branched-subunit amino acid aminotransferase/4-amino-4-deoxychorismate lyase